MQDESYFLRVDEHRFRPTGLVGGAWATSEQHIAPALGLIAHCIELDRDARRGDDLRLTRLSCDILGTVPIEEVEIRVGVLRPGRTIELVEARMTWGERTIVVARAWLSKRIDTTAVAGTALPSLPAPGDLQRIDLAASWPGAFVGSLEGRRQQEEPGHAATWLRTEVPLVAGEVVSPTAAAIGLVDTANGTTPRTSPLEVAFPNLDTTVHLFREPVAGPVGYDTRVSFGPDGVGLTLTVLHDTTGPFGSSAQILTIRPR